MPLISNIVNWIMKKRIHQIELFLKYPHDVQNEWFKKLIGAAQNTKWGKTHDYASIKTPEQYQQKVPISSYEDILPYIIRLRQGEKNLLWPRDIKWFAKSSGTTTSKSKFIPVSKESLEECHFKGGKDMLSIYVNNYPENNIFAGKGLSMGGSHQINEFNNASYYGDLSAIIIQNLPFWVQFMRTPNMSIALLDKWELKIDKMARATIRDNVATIAGVPSWNLILLKKIIEITGKNNILEVWPNLELFIHGGVSFLPYKKQFQKLIPSDQMHYMETYNASEGFFGIQDQKNSDEMLLMLDYGIFYEFVPLEELDKDHPKAKLLHEVEKGNTYAMIISTNAGLWRYMIGDTITFTSVNPYRVKITGRTKNFVNAVGEELVVDNAEKAINIACNKTNAIIKEYTVAPIYFSDDHNAAHEWLIEFEKKPDNLSYFSEILDNALKNLNSDYEAKRYNNMALQKPEIKILPPKTFYLWLKSKGKLGGQHKVPRLSNHRKIVEEILKIT